MKKLTDYIAESEKQLAEKAKSQAQQKFMGMVHAAQQGEKAASPEVAKVAKSMSKSDAADFAKTKHKGLPEKIDEVSLGDYMRKASKSKALAQMSQAFGKPDQETTIQSRTKGLERASDRAKRSMAAAQAATQSNYRAADLANKDALEAELKALQNQFDPMFDRSDDYSYWNKHKDILGKINSLNKRLSALGESSIVESTGDQTLNHILGRFKHEVKKFQGSGELDNDLFDALFDYYSDNGEIPYGIAKARTGDPYAWVSDRLDELLTGKDIEEAVDPIDIPAYRRKGNSRLGGFPAPATHEPARAVNPIEIPAVQRKATQGQTVGTIQPTGEIDVLRKMAGLPPRK